MTFPPTPNSISAGSCWSAARVLGEAGVPGRFVRRFGRAEVPRDGRFRVDDDGCGARQAHDEVRAQALVLGRTAFLLEEVPSARGGERLGHHAAASLPRA
jgi:hypothetical protein